MAFDLPTLDSYMPGLLRGAPLRRAPAPVVEEDNPYERLTPSQKAMVDAQIALQDSPRSALGEIAMGVKRGAMVELPRMVGQALKSTGREGDALYGMGRGLVEGAEAREPGYARDLTPDRFGAVTQAFVEGGEMIAPSLAPLAALPVLGAAGLAATPAMFAAGAAGGALFGASQFQDTYEKAKQAGKTDAEAFSTGLQTGAIEAIGETAGGAALGKFVAGGSRLLPRLFGRKYSPQEALSFVRDPKLMSQFAKDFTKTAAVESGTEMGQAAGQAAVEANAGIDNADPWKAATQALGPTLAMTVMLGPLGALGTRRTQRANQTALKAIEDPMATAKDTNAAAEQLRPFVELMMGRDEFAVWRIDRLNSAKWFDEQREDLRQQRVTQRAQQDAIDEQFAFDAARAPTVYESPTAEQVVGKQGYPQYRSQEEAQQVWDSLSKAYEQQESRQQQVAMFRELENVASQLGLPSFADFSRTYVKARGTKAGQLDLNKGRLSQDGMRLAYIQAANEAVRAQQPQPQAGVTPAEAAQPQLDLEGGAGLGPTRFVPPAAPAPQPRQRTVMEGALLNAGVPQAVNMAQRAKLAQPGLVVAENEQAAQREQDIAKLARVAETTRRVESANQQADNAMSTVGGVWPNANSPVAVEDLKRAAQIAVANAGFELKGQAKKKVELALAATGDAKVWAQQLSALRKARDAMKENSVSRDAMSALIAHLETRAPTIPVETQPRKEVTSDEADPLAERRGDAQAEPVQENAAEQGRQEGLLTQPAPSAAPVAVEVGSPPLTAPSPPVAAPTQAPEAPAKKPPPKPPAPPKPSVVPAQVSVTTTGEEVGAPVAWGDFSRTTEPGDVSYDRPWPVPLPAKEPQRAQDARRKTKSIEIPESERRQGVPEQYMFAFEFYDYDPSQPRAGRGGEELVKGGNPRWRGRDDTPSVNMMWVLDYRRARNLAEGRNEAGVKVRWDVSEKVEAAQMRAHAKAALEWMKGYYGADVIKIADERVEALDKIYDVNERAREFAREAKKSIRSAYEYALRVKRAQAKGVSPDRVKLTAADEAELDRLAEENPGFEYLHAEKPNFQYSDELARAVDTGKMDRVLSLIETNGPTEWARYMAGVLRRLGLKTTIRRMNQVARSAKDGSRVYGRYHHATDSVSVYLGGENVHTVLHETTHAATVGRIAFAIEAAKLPPAARTAEQRAAVASLAELRLIMNEVRKHDKRKQYAFKNEAEFVAELFSNDRFQRWLHNVEANNRPMWKRVLDWMRDLLGMRRPDSVTALDKAMAAGVNFLAPSRFASASALTFEHSPGAAMGVVDEVGTALSDAWNKVAISNPRIGNLPSRMRQTILSLKSTFHLGEMAKRDSSLGPMATGVKQYVNADETKQVLRQNIIGELTAALKPLRLAMAQLDAQKQEQMNTLLGTLAGEQSILGIDLNKNFDENLKADPKLDPSLRQYVNELHSKWRQLPPTMRRAVEDTIKLNRKNFMRITALVLGARLRSYTSTDPRTSAFAKRLDIESKSLHAPGVTTKPEYYSDAYSERLDALLRATFNDLNATYPEDTPLRSEIQEIERLYFLSVGNPYVHLGRSGDYFVDLDVAGGSGEWSQVQQLLAQNGKAVGAPTDERHIFLRFETPAQRDKVMKAISDAKLAASMRGGSIFDPTAQGVVGLNRVVHSMMKKVDEEYPGPERAEVRAFLKRMMLDLQGDSSPRKAMLPRKNGGVPGYDADFVRNASKRGEGAAMMIANAHTMPMYDEAFDSMKVEIDALRSSDAVAATSANDMLSEIMQRFSNSLNPVDSPLIDRAKAFGYNWFLALSPAFMLTNLMQPYHLTLPVLGGRYGFVKSFGEMKSAAGKGLRLMQTAIKGGWAQGMHEGGARGALMGVLDLTLHLDASELSAGEKDMIRALQASGQLDTTQSHELGQLASGESQTWATAMKVLSTGSHYTEVLNRLTAALSAYNLEFSKSGNQLNAERRALETVRATQYDYSDHNTARALGRHGALGKVTPLIASFQQYAFQTMELLYRMAFDSIKGSAEEKKIARLQLAGVMGTTTIIAGTLGLPFANVAAAVADALIGDDDEPFDIKVAYRQWLADVLGNDAAEIIARGVPRGVFGFDMSARAGMQDILPGTRFFADKREVKESLADGALSMLGPAVSAGSDLYVGIDKMGDGQLMDGLLHTLPLALRGPLKSYQMGDVGYTTQTGNKLPMEVTPWAQFVQAVGFTPGVKAEQSEVNFAFRQLDTQLKKRKAVLSNRLYREVEEGNDTTAVLKEIAAFNAQNPQYAISTAVGLKARAKARAVADTTGAGIATLPRYLPLLDQYSYANTK